MSLPSSEFVELAELSVSAYEGIIAYGHWEENKKRCENGETLFLRDRMDDSAGMRHYHVKRCTCENKAGCALPGSTTLAGNRSDG